jgi:hypothetical protein
MKASVIKNWIAEDVPKFKKINQQIRESHKYNKEWVIYPIDSLGRREGERTRDCCH